MDILKRWAEMSETNCAASSSFAQLREGEAQYNQRLIPPPLRKAGSPIAFTLEVSLTNLVEE